MLAKVIVNDDDEKSRRLVRRGRKKANKIEAGVFCKRPAILSTQFSI